jgi:hypothetical protein
VKNLVWSQRGSSNTLRSGVVDVGVIEVVAYDVADTLGAAQVGAGIGRHRGLGSWSATSKGICFDVLVDQFVGVEFEAVAGRKEEPPACRVFFQSSFDFRAAVDGIAGDNEENGLVALPAESA